MQAALALQPRENDFLVHFQNLCRQYPQALARAALETAILRQEAAAKFPQPIATILYLTRQALEQATSYPVARYRAGRYRSGFRFERLLDLGCSVGGDAFALAGVAPVIGVDNDPVRLHMARANLSAVASLPESQTIHPAEFIQADLTCPLPIVPIDSTGIFFDPARRTRERRIYASASYQPPLQVIDAWLEHFPALAVKLSPGIDLVEVHRYPAEVEFISLSGELKECVLWFGPLRTAARRATVLPSQAHMSVGELAEVDSRQPRLSPPQAYLYEPDPAVIRAGLVRHLADEIDATQLDADIAYLTSQKLTNTPFARLWEIEAWFPFQLKRLRAYLRERKVGLVTVKKRGSPLEPQALIRELRLHGPAERVVVLTHLLGEPLVIICLPPAR